MKQTRPERERGGLAWRVPMLALAALGLLGLLAACGDDDDDTPTATSPATTAVGGPSTVASDIANFSLEDLSVRVGDTITWTNQDGSAHTTTAGSPGNQTGMWDSDTLRRDASFSFTFTQAGTFDYFCRFHPSTMQATVTVEQ